MMRTDIANNNN